LILFWGADLPIASIPLDHYRLVINPSLPTIPLFTLAGYFLAEGGASQRLVRVFQALFGQFRGGPALVTALVCAFFTSFTGASGVTILALGGLLMPVLLTAGYPPKSALGLLTGAGSLGLLFPPCLPLILYAIVAKISIEDMFLGGFVPGILMVVLTAWWGTTQDRRGPLAGNRLSWAKPRPRSGMPNGSCSCRRLRSQGCLVGLRHPSKQRPLLRSTRGLSRRSYTVI
jgi:tripartite ATP-independent transporter DctM subunit